MKPFFENVREQVNEFLANTDSLGSFQVILSAEGAGIGGGGVEAGVSIDIKQILYFLANGQWDQSFTQVISFHVGYFFDVGFQAGTDLGLSIAYHTSRVTGVRPVKTVCASSLSQIITL